MKVEDLTMPTGFVRFDVMCDHYRCRVNPKVQHYGSLDEALKAWNRRGGK